MTETKKLTNMQILQACNFIKSANLDAGGKFNYALAKNLQILQKELQPYLAFLLAYKKAHPEVTDEEGGIETLKCGKEFWDTAMDAVEVPIYTVDEETFFQANLNVHDTEKLMWMVGE